MSFAANGGGSNPRQKTTNRIAIAAAALLAVPVQAGEPAAAGFRNDGSGHFQGKVVDSFDLATGSNIRWKVELPDYGVSSPIVVSPAQTGTNGAIVIVTCDPDRVLAYRLADGKELWNVGIGVSPLLKPSHDAALREFGAWLAVKPEYLRTLVPRVRVIADTKGASDDWTPAPGLGWSVPTPVSDGTNVWAVGYRGAVGCIGLDGKKKWSAFLSRSDSAGGTDWLADTFKASPLIVDRLLIATSVKTVFGVDLDAGTNRWRTAFPRAPGKADRQSYRGATPAVWRHGNRTILVWGQGFAVDAGNGVNLSRVWPESVNNTPCLVAGDRMIARYSRVRRGDAPPPDGEPPTPWQLIAWDLSLAGGKLSMTNAWICPPADRFMQNCLGTSAISGLTRIGEHVVACVLDEGAPSEKGLLVAGLADGAQQGAACCVGGASRGQYWQPSPAVAGDRMVVADQDGTVTILDIARTPWKVVSRTSLATPANRGKTGFVMGASPFISGDCMLLRTSRELVCVGPK